MNKYLSHFHFNNGEKEIRKEKGIYLQHFTKYTEFLLSHFLQRITLIEHMHLNFVPSNLVNRILEIDFYSCLTSLTDTMAIIFYELY